MLKKITQLTSNTYVKKILAVSMSLMVVMTCFCCFASATDGTTVTEPTPSSAATTVFNTVHQSLNFSTVLSVIGVALTAALGIVLGWWAVRKVIRVVMSAFKKGRLGV